jgi:hypothetical protein
LLPSLQALLQRLESRVCVKGVSAGCVAGLLRRLGPARPQGRRGGAGGAAASGSQAAPASAQERYPPRIFLCAYMVLAHPGAWLRLLLLLLLNELAALPSFYHRLSHLSLCKRARCWLPLC